MSFLWERGFRRGGGGCCRDGVRHGEDRDERKRGAGGGERERGRGDCVL